jgi:hypothetical protein
VILRLTFLGIAAFWITMNVLLWRAEYGALGGDTPVPVELVWRKILTAPDASSLSVYQHQERMGYCEFSTAIGQQMAALDEEKIPPEGLAKRAGYQIHLAGNVAFGDFTNRFKFDGRAQFKNAREWSELHLKISSRLNAVELDAAASNPVVHVKIFNDGEMAMTRDLAFADLQKPETILRAFAGNFADALLGFVDLPELPAAGASQNLAWAARRTRVKIGREFVPVYRLATSALGRDVTVDVSTLGEILRVNLPGEISARIDDFSRP